MLRLIVRRLLISVPLVLVVTLISFVLLSFLPGNAAYTILGSEASPESVAALSKQLGLDQPLPVQYFNWLGSVLRGDLGTSIINNQPVSQDLATRLPVTLSLVLGALFVAIIVGVAIGVLTATRGGIASRVIDVISIGGLAIPSFWLALLLILAFAVTIRLFPASGYVPFEQSPSQWAWFLVLPVISIALGMITALAKQTRDSMLEVLSSPYIAALRANGISETKIVYKHALRNAAIPVVTVASLLFVGSLTGAVVAEQIFVLPGLGSAVISATTTKDIPVLQGCALVLTLLVVGVNVLADLAYGALNPKVRKR